MPNRTEIRFTAKSIVTSFPRDIYSDRPKNNIMIKLSLSVIRVLIMLEYRSICLSIRDSKMEGVPLKNTGSSHLKFFLLQRPSFVPINLHRCSSRN